MTTVVQVGALKVVQVGDAMPGVDDAICAEIDALARKVAAAPAFVEAKDKDARTAAMQDAVEAVADAIIAVQSSNEQLEATTTGTAEGQRWRQRRLAEYAARLAGLLFAGSSTSWEDVLPEIPKTWEGRGFMAPGQGFSGSPGWSFSGSNGKGRKKLARPLMYTLGQAERDGELVATPSQVPAVRSLLKRNFLAPVTGTRRGSAGLSPVQITPEGRRALRTMQVSLGGSADDQCGPNYPYQAKAAEYTAYTDEHLQRARKRAMKLLDDFTEKALWYERSNPNSYSAREAWIKESWHRADFFTISREIEARRNATRKAGGFKGAFPASACGALGKGPYPFAAKVEQYAGYTDAQLVYARRDAMQARDNAAAIARSYERQHGWNSGGALEARHNEGWYADDLSTILSEIRRRQGGRFKGTPPPAAPAASAARYQTITVETDEGPVALAANVAHHAEAFVDVADAISDAAGEVQEWAFRHQQMRQGFQLLPTGDIMSQLKSHELVQNSVLGCPCVSGAPGTLLTDFGEDGWTGNFGAVAPPLTFAAVSTLRYGQTLYHRTATQAGGREALRVRVTGALKTWKTRPGEFRLPVKWGRRDSGAITHANMDQWSLVDRMRPGFGEDGWTGEFGGTGPARYGFKPTRPTPGYGFVRAWERHAPPVGGYVHILHIDQYPGRDGAVHGRIIDPNGVVVRSVVGSTPDQVARHLLAMSRGGKGGGGFGARTLASQGWWKSRYGSYNKKYSGALMAEMRREDGLRTFTGAVEVPRGDLTTARSAVHGWQDRGTDPGLSRISFRVTGTRGRWLGFAGVVTPLSADVTFAQMHDDVWNTVREVVARRLNTQVGEARVTLRRPSSARADSVYWQVGNPYGDVNMQRGFTRTLTQAAAAADRAAQQIGFGKDNADKFKQGPVRWGPENESEFGASSNEDVVAAWANGRWAQSGSMSTDGQTIKSYNLVIGVTTEDGRKVVYDYRGARAVSKTTNTHVRLAARAGILVPPPGRGSW
jgi:hypothetical protein